jgi:hypothetical protein
MFGDPTIADAILDRLVHNAYRLTLKGESLRKAAAKRHNLDAAPAVLPDEHADTRARTPRWPGSSESPAGFDRNGRPASIGIPGRLRRNTQGSADWPKNPRALADRLRRAQTSSAPPQRLPLDLRRSAARASFIPP